MTICLMIASLFLFTLSCSLQSFQRYVRLSLRSPVKLVQLHEGIEKTNFILEESGMPSNIWAIDYVKSIDTNDYE